MKITVVYTGINEPIVHAAGCRDIARDMRGSHGETVEVADRVALAAAVYDDQIREDPENTAENLTACFAFKPCAHALPESAPVAEVDVEAAVEAPAQRRLESSDAAPMRREALAQMVRAQSDMARAIVLAEDWEDDGALADFRVERALAAARSAMDQVMGLRGAALIAQQR